MPARRCQRVRLSIFLCFFLRIRLRRFLISEPMRGETLPGVAVRAKPDRDGLVVGDAASDDVEAVAPEAFVAHIDAEAGGQLGGVAEPGGRQQVVVPQTKSIGVFVDAKYSPST